MQLLLGIGPRRPLDLDPGPGPTLVVGRNGSRKSSFAEWCSSAVVGVVSTIEWWKAADSADQARAT